MSSRERSKRTDGQKIDLPWLLIATPLLSDPNFRQSVVLIVDHKAEGAMGFVLNRPLSAGLADLVKLPEQPIPVTLPAWYGGPVDARAGLILTPKPGIPAGPPTGGAAETHGVGTTAVAVSGSEALLARLVRKAANAAHGGPHLHVVGEPEEATAHFLYPFRFLVGYAGWGAGQLEDEIFQGAWLKVQATNDLVFDTPWNELWERSMGIAGANPRQLFPPEHEFLN